MHYYYPYTADKANALRNALNTAARLSLENVVHQVGIQGQSKLQMDNNTYREGLGAGLLKDLLDHNLAHLTGVTFHLITDEISPDVFVPMPVLVPFMPVPRVRDASLKPYRQSLIFIPWTEDDLRDYLEAFPDSTLIALDQA